MGNKDLITIFNKASSTKRDGDLAKMIRVSDSANLYNYLYLYLWVQVISGL